MNIGDKAIIKVEICANNLKNPHYNKVVTILELPDRLGLIKVSIDDFPNCNHRDYHNQFYYNIDELEFINPMKCVDIVEMPTMFINCNNSR